VDLVTPSIAASVTRSSRVSVTEVVVQDRARTDAAFDIKPMGLADALSVALDDQALEARPRSPRSRERLRDGVYTVRVTVPLSGATPARLDADLERIGGSYSWYGLTLAWTVRALIGRVVGEYWKLSSPPAIVQARLLTGGSSFAARLACSCCARSAGFRRSMARLWMH